MIPLTEDRKMLGYELLASYLGISCFVTTRHGGCSQGNYASLNCTLTRETKPKLYAATRK